MRNMMVKFGAVLALVLFAVPAQAVEIEQVTSVGGVKAWLVRDTSNPILSLSFSWRGGAALDPDGKEGLANLVSGLLDEGAADLDSQSFQGRLDDLSISLSFDAGRDSFGGSVRTLTANQGEAFRLLGIAMTQPHFDAEPVERIRQQILAGLRRAAENPRSVARNRLMATLFPNHPYGRPSNGTTASVTALTTKDLRGFVQRRLAKDTLFVGVVGNITADALKPLLDVAFGQLRAAATPWKLADVSAPAQGQRIVVQKDVPQSQILFSQAGLKRADPDFYAATVMNYVLGGGSFNSRLNEEIREKRGLAYSAYSYLSPLDATGLIGGGAATQNARVGETLKLAEQIWRDMASSGLTAEELDHAKTYITGSFPLRFDSSSRIARMLVGIQMEDLGMDYLDRRNSLIEAVTLDDVNRVAKRWLDADGLTVVVVGQPEGVTSSVVKK